MLAYFPGFVCDATGFAVESLADFQQAARRAGQPVPSHTTGTKGQGRASGLRAYTVSVRRLSDSRQVTRTTAPGYHSRDEWRRRCLAIQKKLVAELGG